MRNNQKKIALREKIQQKHREVMCIYIYADKWKVIKNYKVLIGEKTRETEMTEARR